MLYDDDGVEIIRPLSFADLRAANRARLPQFKNARGEPAHSQPDGSDWSISDWLMAVTGELGELANLRKKVLRGDLTHKQAQQETADELADVATYLDNMDSSYAVNEHKSFAVHGCGRELAHGSLHTSAKIWTSPRKRIEAALKAACSVNAYCKPPFTILRTP